jgi:hypothetical protein
MNATLLQSVTLPIDGYLSLGWDRDRLCAAASVAGRPWTFYELSAALGIQRRLAQAELVPPGTRLNPSGQPQLFAPNDWRWCEMEDAADGRWPEWLLRFDGETPVLEPTGRRIRAGVLQWRDGHVVSAVGAGHLEYDLQAVLLPAVQGKAGIAGDWLLSHDHGNTTLYRIPGPQLVLDPADGLLRGPWQTKALASYLFGQAQIAPNGEVVYSAYPAGEVRVWLPSGGELDGEMPRTVPQNPNHVFREDGATIWLCSGHDGQACAIGSDTDNGYLGLHGGSEPYARLCAIPSDGERLTAVARWDSVAKVIRVDTLSLDQTWTDPGEPVDPPVPPDPIPAPEPGPLVLLVSTDGGLAPLRVQASVYEATIGRPVTFWRRKQPAVAWTLTIDQPSTADAAPTHVFLFEEPGTYDVQATQADRPKSNIRTVTVLPVPTPAPEPEPPKLTAWQKLLLWLRGRR